MSGIESVGMDRCRLTQRRVAKAADEAERLGKVVATRQRFGLTWPESWARVGVKTAHSTFFRRLGRLRRDGIAGLIDRRRPPPSRLTTAIRGYVEGLGRADATTPTKVILAQVKERFGVKSSIRSVEEVLHSAGLTRPRRRHATKSLPVSELTASGRPSEPGPGSGREELGGAGLAWVRVASDLTGYGLEMARVVSTVARSLPPPDEPIPVDRANRDEKGQFLSEYNAPRERRDAGIGAVFESVDEKRHDKDLTRLSIAGTRVETLEKKLLALIALPVVTDQGRFEGVTEPRGEWFESLGTHDYMPETLAKFARELKWAAVSGPLMERHASLWHGQLATALGEDASAVVLYIDSTAKPYWTHAFHKSGRVAMVGRVMPCLETVLIQTGNGVPLYLKTYAGHAPLVKNVLPLIHEMEAAIGKGMLGRLTVIDGEISSAALFKRFDADIDPRTGEIGRHFITPLHQSQVKTLDSVQDLTPLEPYRDGDRIGGGWLDLSESGNRKAAPFRSRVIVLERRTKKTFSVYATNAPKGEYSNESLMDAYFARWPAQEHVIRELNGAVAFKVVHGYGKRRVTNIAIVDDLTRLDAQVQRLNQRLEQAEAVEREAVSHLREAEEANEDQQFWNGAAHRWKEHVAERHKEHTDTYRRAASDAEKASIGAELEELKLDKAARSHEAALAKVEQLRAKLIEKNAAAEQLASRREIYQLDVELDQILSVLKLGCALLVQFVMHNFFGSMALEFNTFIREIIALSGVRIITPTTETIQFRANRRNPKLMKALEEACQRFNLIRHRRDERLVRFEVLWPPGSQRHAT